jgi:tetratricopeptide (TPR) repeat protein
MSARLRATSAPDGPSHPMLNCLGLGPYLGLGLCLLAAIAPGCASSNASVSTSPSPATPSFMLSDQEKAERNLKDPAALHLAYGHFEEQVGQPGEAHKSYEKALAENPHSIEAVLGLARLDQLADKPQEAEAGFQRALKMKPGDPAVLAACGQFYASQKRWPEALRDLNAAIAAAPKVPAYKHRLAIAEVRAGDINAGLAVFNQLVGPEKAHYNVAFLLAQEGKPDAAAVQCQVALSINPKFEPARTMLDQLQSHQVASNAAGTNRPTPGGQVRPASVASSGNGFGPVSAGSVNQPTSGTAQASWQSSATASNGSGMATRAAGTFDPALPKASVSGTGQSPDYSSDPWAKVPAPPQ